MSDNTITLENSDLYVRTNYSWLYKTQDIVSAVYIFVSLVWQFTILFQIMVFVVLICHAAILWMTNSKQLAYSQLIWIVIFGVFFILGDIAGFPVRMAEAVRRLATTILYYLTINAYICQVSTEEKLRKFARNITLTMTILSVYLLFIQAGTLGMGGLGREIRLGTVRINYPIVGVVSYNGNWIGQPSAMAALLQFYLFDRDRKFSRLLLVAAMSVFVLLSGSRKALIILIGAPVIFLFLKEDRAFYRIRTLLIGAVFGVAVIFAMLNIPLLYETIGARMENYILSLFGQIKLTEGSAIHRGRMIDIGIELFKARPFTGYGLDNYKFLGDYRVYSHNNYIELMVSGGVFALVAYYWWYLYIIVKTFFSKGNRKAWALSLSLIVLMPIVEYGWVIYLDRVLFIPMTIAYYFLASERRKELFG